MNRAACLLLALTASLCAQPFFECQPPAAIITTAADCEGLTSGTVGGFAGPPTVQSVAGCGFPTQGTQYLHLPAANAGGLVSSPPTGGPLPRPLIGAENEVQIGIPVGSFAISFDCDYFNGEGGTTGGTFNDGASVDIVDPTTGLSVLNLFYADTDGTPLAPGSCADPVGTFAPETDPGGGGTVAGPESISFNFPPQLPPGAFVSVVCWNAGDDAASGAFKMDNVAFAGGAILAISQTGPGVGDLTLSVTNIPPATFEGWTLVSGDVALPVGQGAFFGLQPDSFTFSLVSGFPFPTVGSPIHWLNGFPGIFPSVPFTFAPGSVTGAVGASLDFLSVMIDTNFSIVGTSNLVRYTFL